MSRVTNIFVTIDMTISEAFEKHDIEVIHES